MKRDYLIFIIISGISLFSLVIENLFACTIIAVGKGATTDGSVINANASDSRTTRTWLDIVPHRKYPTGAMCPVFQNSKRTVSAADLSAARSVGEIPQVAETFGYLNTGYPCMNAQQVSVTESTFGGRDTLRNKNAMFACEELCRMIVERAQTAREAIRVIDELTLKYGYNEGGEALAIADKNEIWLLEIIGCGHDQIGAVWVAQRVPDGHVTVSANGSRILELDLADPENSLASKNVFEVAQKYGWWSPESGTPFRFAYVYGPESRRSMAARRREWRVFDLVAHSLNLDPNASDFPFSVKPDTLVAVEAIMTILRDTFEGTEFDMTKNITTIDKSGQCVKSPYANPFMDYDMMPLFKINGGWGKMGERSIARYFCNYTVICQSRAWLPNLIGGVVWHGFDNPATTIQVPIYIGVSRLPESYKISGRPGFKRDCAWWAFNRVADLAAQKWGDMRVDVDSVRTPLQHTIFQEKFEAEQVALKSHAQKPVKAAQQLTEFTNQKCEMIVARWWQLGDDLWSKYTGKF
jgi:dipeptidase